MIGDVTVQKLSAFRRKIRGWLDGRDRVEIFTETAVASTDASPAYWSLLILSGAIAALGLALDSAAVVIGAMLIAPLLAPVTGFALALAIGDGRLALETALVIVLSTVSVVLVTALLSFALPVTFQAITQEIASRTRPTTLDLGVAAFSGLAGAAVTVSRGKRLSGAIPGVAVSVALVPPLAVAGYGIGIGWNWLIIRGSLLLYTANLAGIVMSAMLVFLVAGMRQEEVLEKDRNWHGEGQAAALAVWVERIPGLRSLGLMGSVWARIGLVAVFVALVAIPLSQSLREIARESRVKRAVSTAAQRFSAPGRSFVVRQQVEIGEDRTRVILDVATTKWYGDSVRVAFEKHASAIAREPVLLTLEQVPAASGDISQLSAMLGAQAPSSGRIARTAPTRVRVESLRDEIAYSLSDVTLPDSVVIVGSDLALGDSISGPLLTYAYTSRDSLTEDAQQMVRGQIAHSLGLPRLRAGANFVSLASREISSPIAAVVDTFSVLTLRFSRLSVEIRAASDIPRERVDSVRVRFRRSTVVIDSTKAFAGRISLGLVPERP
ncbi:MAG: TIGR00341 family protein [Gemmatimonadales bacterium]